LIKKDAINDDMIYIGSTINIDERWGNHKNHYNNPNSKEYNQKNYQYIRENGGIDEWELIVIDEIEIALKKCVERDKCEEYYIKKYDAVNKLNCKYVCRTRKEYNDENKEKITEYQNIYRDKNREKLLEDKKVYHINNREKILEYKKLYHKKNRDVLIEKMKEPVVCNLCGTFSTKTHLKRHQQTQKCKNKSSLILDDEP
jgi:hypothetical protein